MERKISYSVYASAFLISAGIFILGILVGQVIGNSNLEKISGEVNNASNRLETIQFLYLSDNGSASFCPLYKSEVDSLDNDIEVIGYKLTYLENERGVYDNELKKRYFILEGQSHLLSKRINTLCGEESILLINFYSNTNCDFCKEEGIEILKARDALDGKIRVKLFSFDGDIGSPIAQGYKNQYNITKYPTIVINDKKYEGTYTSDQLIKIFSEVKNGEVTTVIGTYSGKYKGGPVVLTNDTIIYLLNFPQDERYEGMSMEISGKIEEDNEHKISSKEDELVSQGWEDGRAVMKVSSFKVIK